MGGEGELLGIDSAALAQVGDGAHYLPFDGMYAPHEEFGRVGLVDVVERLVAEIGLRPAALRLCMSFSEIRESPEFAGIPGDVAAELRRLGMSIDPAPPYRLPDDWSGRTPQPVERGALARWAREAEQS